MPTESMHSPGIPPGELPGGMPGGMDASRHSSWISSWWISRRFSWIPGTRKSKGLALWSARSPGGYPGGNPGGNAGECPPPGFPPGGFPECTKDQCSSWIYPWRLWCPWDHQAFRLDSLQGEIQVVMLDVRQTGKPPGEIPGDQLGMGNSISSRNSSRRISWRHQCLGCEAQLSLWQSARRQLVVRGPGGAQMMDICWKRS